MKLSSKTLRMSRSTEGRNAQTDMARRGRASTSRAALLEPDVVLTGRRFRRANRLSRAEAALYEAILRPGSPLDALPGVAVIHVDRLDRTGVAMG